MDREMKNKTHLFYGIIIGMLLTLCLGMTKEEQKNFKEIREVRWLREVRQSPQIVLVTGGFYEGEQLFLRSQSPSPDILHKAGWTIIDWDGYRLVDNEGGGAYLIGK